MSPIVRILREPDHFMQQRPGCNAYNGLLQVHILADLGSSESWVGVLAQEMAEVGYKWRRGLLLPFFVPSMGRELELVGHATECAAAVYFDGLQGQALLDYVRLKASALPQYADLGFGSDIDGLAAELRQRMPERYSWVSRNADVLRAHMRTRAQVLKGA